MDILPLLKMAKSKGASDLHLITSSPPLVRINGVLAAGDSYPPLTPEDMDNFYLHMTCEKDRKDFEKILIFIIPV